MARPHGFLPCAIFVISLVAGAHAQSPASTCRSQHIDKYFKFVVASNMCNAFSPGNVNLRGPTAGFPAVTECVLVNGTLPGPSIRVNKGDWVQVDVLSDLYGREVSFHWHGITMRGTPWSDGAAMISSCPIMPQGSASYVFQALDAGTFYYQGRTGLEEEYGMAGLIIVDDPNDPYKGLYDEEYPGLVVQLRDWWRIPDAHVSTASAFNFFQAFDPQGLPMINGYFGGHVASINVTLPPPVFNLAVNTCYRTRWMNGNTEWPGWTFNLTDPSGNPVNQTLIALAGQNLKPMNTYSVAFYIGQRAETIFCTGAAGDYMLRVDTAQPQNETYCPLTTNTVGCKMNAIFRVGGINTTVPKTANRTKLASYPFHEVIDSLKRADLIAPYTTVAVPTKANQVWMIYLGIIRGNMYAWGERNWGFEMPTAPFLFTKGGRCGLPEQYNAGQNISIPRKAFLQRAVANGTVVDIIFNNLSPFMQPMHLHGHAFTVLGNSYIADAGYNNQPQDLCPKTYLWANPAWDGAPGPPWASNIDNFAFGCPYDSSNEVADSLLSNPFTSDSIPVPAHGWTYTRVKFDNPGAWSVYSGLYAHMVNGMAFVVDTALDKVAKIPSWVDTSCGGECMPLNQMCGAYSPTAANLPKCSRPGLKDDVCEPVFGGPGTAGFMG